MCHDAREGLRSGARRPVTPERSHEGTDGAASPALVRVPRYPLSSPAGVLTPGLLVLCWVVWPPGRVRAAREGQPGAGDARRLPSCVRSSPSHLRFFPNSGLKSPMMVAPCWMRSNRSTSATGIIQASPRLYAGMRCLRACQVNVVWW